MLPHVLRASRRRCCSCSAARSPASPATGCSGSCSAIYGFILGAMLASSMMGVSNTIGMIVAALVGGIAGALDSGVRVLRRHRARRRRPRRARRARRLELRSAPAIRRRSPSSSLAVVGADRRDGAAALRDHRRDGVRRRVDDDRRRRWRVAGDRGATRAASPATSGFCIRMTPAPGSAGCRSRGSCSGLIGTGRAAGRDRRGSGDERRAS